MLKNTTWTEPPAAASHGNLLECKFSGLAPDLLNHSKGGAKQSVLTSLPGDSDV